MELKADGLLWGFGNHEPMAMYRRTGKRSTGGVPGGARWMADWHHFYDSEENAELLKNAGVNILHCRFFKGLGWEAEKEDFPAVRSFANHCRARGIKVLAYVQFATLYHEIMSREIPQLKEWAARDEDGKCFPYAYQYWRWIPCIHQPEFEAYLQKIVRIAMEAGCFDGVMFDNVFSRPCHCPRCRKAFQESLSDKGFEDFLSPEHTDIPPTIALGFQPWLGDDLPPERALPQALANKETMDPVVRAYMAHRAESLAGFFARMRQFIKAQDPDFILSGNINLSPARDAYNGIDRFSLIPQFDLIVSQTDNQPAVTDGCVVTQIPELKAARMFHTLSLPLNDADASTLGDGNAALIARWGEALTGGGILCDRSPMRPLRGGGLDRELYDDRRKMYRKFRQWESLLGDALQRPRLEPVGVLYSRESVMYSLESLHGILRTQESLMRRKIPFRLVAADRSGVLDPAWQRLPYLIVPEALLLSDRVIAELRAYPGKLYTVGPDCGRFDEEYGERAGNPLTDYPAFPVPEHQVLVCRYRTRVQFGRNNWDFFPAEVPKLTLPEEAAADFRMMPDNSGVGALFITCPIPCPGGTAELPAGQWMIHAFGEDPRPAEVRDGRVVIPPFTGVCAIIRQ